MPDVLHETEELKAVTIFTDGGADPNPGHGGFGVVLRSGNRVRELSGGYDRTTNNRMELMAVIAGLEALKKRCRVKLYCDSRYIVDAINKGSAMQWRNNAWSMSTNGSTKAKNSDLWERLLAAYNQHEVEFIWVKGHAGLNDNERCDQLASAAMRKPNLPPDEGYAPPTSTVTPEGERSRLNSNVPQHGQSRAKMTHVNQACRSCGTPVVKKLPKKRTVKPGQTWYYDWYLYCPGCNKMYLVEEAKREVTDEGRRLPHDKKPE